MDICKKIKIACIERGTNINALEQELGFARGSIYKWNMNRPSVDKLKAVADKLEKPMDYFMEE